MDSDETLYATPRRVTDPDSCHFYHAMDVPGYGPTKSPSWDLRPNTPAYLGGVDLHGKRVLEIGPASGYLTFWMEAQGADVVSIELPLDHAWDIVPDVSLDTAAFERDVREGVDHIRDAYWYAHEATGSKAKVYYGDVYALPDALGHFDYAVIAAVLLHLRDPLRAVEQCARLADNLIITDVHHEDIPDDKAYMEWFSTKDYKAPHVWFKFSPYLFVRFAEVLGFDESTVTFHDQLYTAEGPPRPGLMFTVVSRRDAASGQT